MNKLSIVEQMSLWDSRTSFGYMARNGIQVCLKIEIFPIFLRNCQIDFQSSCISLHTHQQWRSILALKLHQHVLSLEFLILDILRVILIYTSLMMKDVEHFFGCFLAIQDCCVKNSLCSSLSYLIGLFGLLVCNFLNSLYVLNISPVRYKAGKDLFPI